MEGLHPFPVVGIVIALALAVGLLGCLCAGAQMVSSAKASKAGVLGSGYFGCGKTGCCSFFAVSARNQFESLPSPSQALTRNLF